VQQAYAVPNFYTKVSLLKWLLKHEKGFTRVLLFVKNKKMADILEQSLQEFAGETGVIHSNKSQPARFAAVKDFQSGAYRLLVATDVIARGLDLQEVTHVVNFDIPKDPGSYIHRIGRTGRADKAGVAISFITPDDSFQVVATEQLMGRSIPVFELPEAVEISEELIADEMPVKRDKNLKKTKKVAPPTGAFHEKKARNKKVQLGGKRRQEKQRRALAKSRSKR
jgi:ATP-dependent RNA helicase RhlE